MKKILILVLLLLVVIFTAQNYEVVEIRFLGWSLTMSRAVILFLTLVIGISIGWLMSLTGPGSRGEKDFK